jgi:hypothetical protein
LAGSSARIGAAGLRWTNGAGLAVEGPAIAGRLGALLAVDIERIGGALDVEPFGGQLGAVGLERRGAARGIEGPALARCSSRGACRLGAVDIEGQGLERIGTEGGGAELGGPCASSRCTSRGRGSPARRGR